MAAIIPRLSKFRDVVSNSTQELVVFISDVLAQPDRDVMAKVDPYVYTKCSRALPIARAQDLVVLTGRLDQDYYRWLRKLGFGPDHVVAYEYEGTDKILTDLIRENPGPLKKIIDKTGRAPVLVPFYSGQEERLCADLLNADLFGAEAGVCSKYFNKTSFKEECRNLGIEVVGGTEHELDSDNLWDYDELERHVLSLLSHYDKVIIRGEQGSAGRSVFEAQSSNIEHVYDQIKRNQDKRVLIEPMLKVVSSPNDQWAIDRDGYIHHLGITAQLFEGLKHAGNQKGQYFSDRTYNGMTEISLSIVKKMAADGYRGVMGIDYIIAEQGIYPIENNARVNGSTFTYAIVDNIEEQIGKVRCWKFFKAKTKPGSFSELMDQMGRLLYDGTVINRVFPYDCDCLSTKGTFAAVLLAEDMYHIDFLEQTLKHIGIERV